jgi:hypothetical protein
MPKRSVVSSSLVLSVAFAAACGGNPYGHAPEYVPLSDEESHQDRAAQLSYEEVRRDPEGYRDRTLGWFGVVTSVKQEPEGRARIGLALRFHQERHLCSGTTDDTCSVTVSDRSGGPFTAIIEMRQEDQSGSTRLANGSLLRVYGHVNGDFDDEGGPIVIADYYRHWPHGAYVTTAARNSMRR